MPSLGPPAPGLRVTCAPCPVWAVPKTGLAVCVRSGICVQKEQASWPRRSSELLA